MRIVISGQSFEFNGRVLLEYFGSNYDLENCLTSKPANLSFRVDRPADSKTLTNDNILFKIDLIQFQDEKLMLDIYNGNVVIKRDNSPVIIGEVVLSKICVEDTQILIAGNYRHESINLAWYNDDLVKFYITLSVKIKYKQILISSFLVSILVFLLLELPKSCFLF